MFIDTNTIHKHRDKIQLISLMIIDDKG